MLCLIYLQKPGQLLKVKKLELKKRLSNELNDMNYFFNIIRWTICATKIYGWLGMHTFTDHYLQFV